MNPTVNCLICVLCVSPDSLLPAETRDVVVYGGTSAGVVAAVQTARQGRSVVLIEPGQHLGGLTSGGLGWTDSGNKAVIGGVSREFYQRIKKHYDNAASWPFGKRAEYDRYRPADDAMWTFEPRVAETTFGQMLDEHNVSGMRGQRLVRKSGVRTDGKRIVSITMESGETYSGRVFIDATYEGDLMAAAGVSYAVGRESNKKYDETVNGVAKRYNTHKHRFVVDVDPYLVAGDPESGLLPGVHGDPPGEEGTGDHRIQAYCFRMCMSNVLRNRVPFPKPDDYSEKQYELLLRNFEAGDLRLPLKPDMMPNGKTDTNNNCAFSTDNIGMNYAYPEASYADRQKIIAEHETYQKGLMWTLANHPRVPQTIRETMSHWGLAKDEFTDNGNWPHQIYVREARRMIGDYVASELDCRRIRVCEDSVGLGSYNMDSHNVQRYVTTNGYVQNEGDVQESPGGPYLVSYRSIVPKRGEVENLLVPVCVSSSHIAYGSIRMEPVFMILGQSAASAAVLAIEKNIPVQDIGYADLRGQLLKDGQVLDLPPNSQPKKRIGKESLGGIAVDDSEADFLGEWSTSASVSPYVESGYRHDNNDDKGNKVARFTADLKPGRYDVLLSWTTHANRASNVPVVVRDGDGNQWHTVNQRKTPGIKGLLGKIGEFEFGDTGSVLIGNEKTDGYVIVDAVVFVPVKSKQ